jgi:hypothetical protein
MLMTSLEGEGERERGREREREREKGTSFGTSVTKKKPANLLNANPHHERGVVSEGQES